MDNNTTYNNFLKVSVWFSWISFILFLLLLFLGTLFAPVAPRVFNEKDNRYISDESKQSEITSRFQSATTSLSILSFSSTLVTLFLFSIKPYNN